MPKLSPEILAAIWQRAGEEEIGISIAVSDPKQFRFKIWEARPEEYRDFMTFLPEGRNEVFLVRKSVELPDVAT